MRTSKLLGHKDGVIADFQAAEHMIRGMIKMMKGSDIFNQL